MSAVAVSVKLESLSTPRFLLRPLQVDDVTEAYSRWFDDPEVARYVVSARKAHNVAVLRRYVEERNGREDVLFLGIFTRDGASHIGNIKYEPVNQDEGFSVMGILIGDRAWRGQGVAHEVIDASARWLQVHRGIREIRLGVSKTHRSAIAAYEKIGFRRASCADISVDPETHVMVWRLDSPGESSLS